MTAVARLPFTSLNAATTTGAGTSKDLEATFTTHFMIVTATGSPSAWSVDLEGSHDGTHWLIMATGSLGGGVARITDYPLRYVRANLTTLTGGTSPTVTATIGSA